MRKCFLVVLMAAAMFAVASPAASVAGSKTHFCPPGTHSSAYCECPPGTTDKGDTSEGGGGTRDSDDPPGCACISGHSCECPPGTHNSAYCECPPGTHNSAYCQCPPGTHNSAYCQCPKGTKDSRGEKGSACCVQGTPQDTANAAAAAALGAAELLTDKSKTISFSFKATVCGELHFVLQFAKQGGHGHPKTFYIDVAVASSSTTAGAVDTITVPLSLDAETILASDAAEHRTLTVSVIAVSTVGSTSATAQLNGSYAVTHGKFHHGH